MSLSLTPAEARAVLGLSPDASPHDVMGAFREAAKRLHPDRPGGDADAFHEVLVAYRTLQALPPTPSPLETASGAYVEIDPMTALGGGEVEAAASDGRRLRLRIPTGARHGESLSAGGESFSIRITAGEDMQVRGADLWVTVEVPAARLEDGGRVIVPTPLGDKVLWISRKVAERRLVRLEGQGLPARGEYLQGSLFIRLVPGDVAESGARAQLKKFAAAWAA